jgi:UDP-N-acetyl-D-mannosaminuronic acid dehydrogenase
VDPGTRETDIVVMGGCGHVGLPLGIALAASGLSVELYDIDVAAVVAVNEGRMPFMEPGAPPVLRRVLDEGLLRASTDPVSIARARTLVVVIGTPVDEHLNPDPWAVRRAVSDVAQHLRDGQLIVLRSTVYPGVTRLVEDLIDELALDIDVAFCPERIAEGKAMVELYELPQIVAARSDAGREGAEKVFRRLTDHIVFLSPEEAELAKLFTNTWRYIKFATANQLYMIANSYGLDFERIRSGLTEGYERAMDMPGAGFSAGPCLFKDTMQLAAFNNNNFTLGHAAMMINEGLPMYVVSQLEQRFDLRSTVVGILGMAFKGESDDIRSSLSYKLKRILRYRAAGVLCTDPFVSSDPDLLPLDQVLLGADLLIVAAPHRAYSEIETSKPIVDIWNLTGNGVLV